MNSIESFKAFLNAGNAKNGIIDIYSFNDLDLQQALTDRQLLIPDSQRSELKKLFQQASSIFSDSFYNDVLTNESVSNESRKDVIKKFGFIGIDE